LLIISSKEKTLLFVGANGFPASSYSTLLKKLEPGRLETIDLIGHGISTKRLDWHKLSDEVISTIEVGGLSPVVGLGHSMGAMVMLISAAKRPELFSRLILLDPLLLGTAGSISIAMSRLSGFRLGYKAPRVARTRKTEWTSKAAALEYFSHRPIFKQFHKHALRDYVEYGLKESKNGVTLSFAKETEAAIFSSVPAFLRLYLPEVEVCTVTGERSDILPLVDFFKWRERISRLKQWVVPGGHLFPFESPYETAALINALLSSRDLDDLDDLGKEVPDHASELRLKTGRESFNMPSNDVVVDLPALEVGAWLAEISNWSQFNPSIVDFAYIDKKTQIRHSTFKHVVYETGTKMAFVGKILNYQPGERVTVELRHSAINIVYDYILVPLERKSKIMASINFQFRGAFKLLGLLWAPSMRQSFAIQLAGQMKVFREGGMNSSEN
jgi:pimeloyl-ACP methyl ester carboxylesterase